MTKTVAIRQLTPFGIPVLLIGVIIFVTRSAMFNISPGALSIGITIDLLFTVPVIHYLLLKNAAMPKSTVLPFFVIGIVVATIILPEENQQPLQFAKTWILPVVEVFVIALIAYKGRAAIKDYNQNIIFTHDFYTALKNVCFKLLPKVAAILLASEIAVFYYGFIRWRKLIPDKNEFTYHKNSGSIGLLTTIIFLVIAETFIIHLLLARWNVLAAWTFTALSIYTAIQLFGFLKSITMRPIVITEDKLFLRYGILRETIVNIDDILSVDITSKSIEFDKETRSLSPFGDFEGHNVIIKLKKENILNGLYGINRKFRTLAMHVDNKEEFKRQIERI